MAAGRIIPVFDHSARPNAGRMPAWIRQSLASEGYGATAATVADNALHTVCEEARCPNRGECWSRGTATFMLLGEICTRACAFCSVQTGRPRPVDLDEPVRVAEAVQRLGLNYVVLTSVNRDELPDGGASIFAATLRALRQRCADIGLEILTPDFRGCQESAIEVITGAADENLVWGHNVETVPALYREVRKGADYRRSLRLLELAENAGVVTKSSLMLGLGETREQVLSVLQDLRAAGVDRLALGQYLRPTRHHLPVREYLSPEAFAAYAEEAYAAGFQWVRSGPMVRSSYHAEAAEPPRERGEDIG